MGGFHQTSLQIHALEGREVILSDIGQFSTPQLQWFDLAQLKSNYCAIKLLLVE